MKTFLIAVFFFTAVVPDESHYFFVFLNKKTDRVELPKEEGEKIMEGHMANINRLAKEGKLVAAGPLEGGGGIFIFKATSLQEVTEWVNSDPGVKAKRWNIETLPYSIITGKLCGPPEIIEMIKCEFIRFNTGTTYSGKDATATVKEHEAYMKKLSSAGGVMASGQFDSGGMLILTGALNKEIIEADPAVREGLYQPEYKKLFIAKGSFCD